MALVCARLLMRAVTASRAHAAAAHTGHIGLAATYARCAPLHSSLTRARRWIASAAASSAEMAPSTAPLSSCAPAALAASSSAPPTPLSLATVRAQLEACTLAQRPADAELLIREFERQGGRCDLDMLIDWISCCRDHGDWPAAEQAWARISELQLKPNNSSYSALIQVYTRAGGEQLAKIDPLLTDMHQSGAQFSARNYSRLIKRAHVCSLPAEVRRWSAAARAAGLFDSLDGASRRIAAQASDRVASAVSASSDAQAASSSASASSVSLTAADRTAVLSQLKAAIAEGDSAAASRCIAAFEQRGGRCTVAMLNMLIGCHEQAGDWLGAERVWARISELQLEPDNHSYRALLQVYTRVGGDQLAKIEPLLTRMQQSGVQLAAQDYERLIKTAHQCELPAEVRRWCALVRAAGLFDSLDRATRRIASHPANRVDSAVAVARVAPSSSVPASSSPAASSSPLTAGARTVVLSQLKAAMTEGDSSAASQIIGNFEQRGGRCDVGMLNQWIKSHEQSGDWQGAERVWARFGELGLKPDSRSYCALIQVFTRAGGDQLAKMDPLLAQMQSSGLSLSATDCQSLIKSAWAAKLPAAVHKWGNLARGAGVFDKLDLAARRIVGLSLAALKGGGAAASPAALISPLDHWFGLSDEAKRANRLGLSLLLSEISSTGDTASVARVIAECDRLDIGLDVHAFNAWLRSFLNKANLIGAERVWDMMMQRGLQPNSVSYRRMIQQYTLQKSQTHLDKIPVLLAEMAQTSLAFDLADYEKLIKTASKQRLPAELCRWSDHAHAAGLWHKLHLSLRIQLAEAAVHNAGSRGLSALQRWSALSDQQKRDNRLALPMLRAELPSGAAATEKQLMAECAALDIAWDATMITAWINHYEQAGDWAGAERAWRSFEETRVKPTSESYTALIQVYTRAGGEQLAKIDPLLAEMWRSDIRFQARDYEMLVHAARQSRSASLEQRWREMARDEGLIIEGSAPAVAAVDLAPRKSRSSLKPLQSPVPAAAAVKRVIRVPSMLYEAIAAFTASPPVAAAPTASSSPVSSSSSLAASSSPSVAAPEYSTLGVVALRALLADRGLKKTGVKAELLQRLKQADEEANSDKVEQTKPAEADAKTNEPTANAAISSVPAPTVAAVSSTAAPSAAVSSTPIPAAAAASSPVADLSALTVAELKKRLGARGLKVSGLKAELVARLKQAEV